MTKSAGQIQADITKAESDGEIKNIINASPAELRQQLINHAVTVRGMRQKAEMEKKRNGK
ncbi:MAG: hypothetical protein KAR42_15570 [candidate division Zixibacteria bacterium]|nr:hypothetical protein [candidate division Zixibacteria bacterium]